MPSQQGVERGFEKARAIIEEKEVLWPQATPQSVQFLIEKRLRVRAFPSAILLDRKGKVAAYTSEGSPLRGNHLVATLERVLSR